MLPQAGKRDAELATSNPDENGFEMELDIKGDGAQHPSDPFSKTSAKRKMLGTSIDAQATKRTTQEETAAKKPKTTKQPKTPMKPPTAPKPPTASESPTALESPAAPATPESPAAPKPPTASAKKPKTGSTDSKYFKRGETRTSNAVWKKTNAKLLDTAYPPPYLKGVLYMLWYLHGGGLFTKETLHSFQSCLLRWSEKEPNITEATRLEKIQEQVGSFQDFHKHSLFLPNAKHPFNFVLVRPELLKGVASHLKIQAEKMVWKPIDIDPIEASNSAIQNLSVHTRNERSAYSMFGWGKIGSTGHEWTDDTPPDDWKDRGRTLLSPETMAEIDQLSLNTARLLYPDLGECTLDDLNHTFLVHPGIVQTKKAYHQRLHYDRPNPEKGRTFFLHVPLTTDGMLLRILPEGKDRSEFIFVPFGCALAVPVNLAHAGIYAKPGSKIKNSRLHIVVTARDAVKYHEKLDVLVSLPESPFPTRRFHDALKPNKEQDRFSQMYVKLLECMETKERNPP
ncbi:unnamed protein product [Cylindrotheca closterium]|uniref:Uncharacterized protein n=1 Tax=Cylindrotheca closterium TaxID=2856 RepID=A0AAD2GDH0_9STRA|nr:unnamed protein product [Cylindrotheca closterium]